MTGTTRRQFLGGLAGSAVALTVPPVFSPGRLFGEDESAAQGDVLLNYNESPYGPSPRAIKAIRDANVALYGRYFAEDTYDTLSKALAEHHGVSREHIRVTVGSTEVLKICDDVFLGERARLVVAEPAYEAVIQYAVNSKATATKVPLTAAHAHDLQRMAAATTAETGLVYICNPNNPTGTIVRRDELATFMAAIPRSVMVVIDEAYSEFVTDPGFESAVRYVREGRSVIVAKTFSKIHGLAGMRVGYAIAAPAIIDKIKPFTVDFATTGIAANAALAAIGDRQYVNTVARRNAEQRQIFVAEMRIHGFVCAEPHGNFVMVNVRRPVAPLIPEFAKRRVFVGREFPAMPTFLRVTLGTDAEMKKFYAAFREILRP